MSTFSPSPRYSIGLRWSSACAASPVMPPPHIPAQWHWSVAARWSHQGNRGRRSSCPRSSATLGTPLPKPSPPPCKQPAHPRIPAGLSGRNRSSRRAPPRTAAAGRNRRCALGTPAEPLPAHRPRALGPAERPIDAPAPDHAPSTGPMPHGSRPPSPCVLGRRIPSPGITGRPRRLPSAGAQSLRGRSSPSSA